MNARCDEPFVRISITITGPEPIFPWGRTYRSHERFSRPKGARRSGTASRWNASPLRTVGCLKRVENSQAARCSFWRLKFLVRTLLAHFCASTNWFTRIKQGLKPLDLCGLFGGITSTLGCTQFAGGTVGLDTDVIVCVTCCVPGQCPV